MNITIEQIDEVRKRTNCSYEEAKMFLEKHNGNIVEAIIDLEKKQRTSGNRNNHNSSNLGSVIKEWINKGLKTKFIIEKKGEILLSLPILILIVTIFIPEVFFWVIVALVILFLMKYRFKIKKIEGDNIDINEMFSSATQKKEEQFSDLDEDKKTTENVKNTNNDEEEEKGYDEITIE